MLGGKEGSGLAFYHLGVFRNTVSISKQHFFIPVSEARHFLLRVCSDDGCSKAKKSITEHLRIAPWF